MSYKRIAQLKTAEHFRQHTASLQIDLPVDEVIEPNIFQRPISFSKPIGNRFCILPMEGWDGTTDGQPSELTTRRWINFGRSGAKLIWGGEAVAVRHDGRANPNQLWLHEDSLSSIEQLRVSLVNAHHSSFAQSDDLLVGLQLTHSGRFCRPNEKNKPEPMIAYRHPHLDRRLKLDQAFPVLTDDDLRRLVDDFVRAAGMAQRIGFDFVDIKHCHGYLGHELLSAVDRTGRYGGSLENRCRWLQEIITGIHSEAPGWRSACASARSTPLPSHRAPMASASERKHPLPTDSRSAAIAPARVSICPRR